MKKAKCLVIAPYEGLKEAFLSIASFYDDEIELNIQTGNLNDGLEIVKTLNSEEYDVVISRGGTATLIRNNTDYLVVDIGISGYDYMRTFKMIENIEGKKAIIGFKNITTNAISVNQFMNADVDIFTIETTDDLLPLLKNLEKEDYKLIVGDTVTIKYANEMNINSLTLISGEESVRKSVEDAIALVNKTKEKIERNKIIDTLHTKKGWQTIVLNLIDNEYLVFPTNSKPLINPQTLKNYLMNQDTDIVIESSKGWISAIIKYLDDYHVVIHLRKLWQNKYEYKGITAINYSKNLPKKLNSLKDFHSKELLNTIQKVAKLTCSILLVGDAGVGKSQLAKVVHQHTQYKEYPFIEIDCLKVSSDTLKVFLKLYKTRRGTLHFTNIETLTIENQLLLIKELSSINKDNIKVIGSAHPIINNYLEEGKIDSRFYKMFADTVIYVPNIEDSNLELQENIMYYLLKANTQQGKQITTIEKEAITLLKNFKWTYNFDQLEQVINQLVTMTTGNVVTAKNTEKILKGINVSDISSIELEGTLEEIERKIIIEVINQEGGNVSKAANRLNISRSTIWRKFKIK